MKYIGLIIAVFAALAAVFLVLKFSGKEEVVADPQPQPVQVGQAAAPEVKTANIYVAARDIPIGSQLDENMLTTQPWPEHLLLPGFVSTPEEGRKLIDMVARASFQADEPINISKLVNPEDPNFLAGGLPKGMRVVTMQTDEIAGVAGFIFPGDRVDVLVTHNIFKDGVSEKDLQKNPGAAELKEEVTEALLTNIRILAVDQRATAGVDERTGIIIPRSVSLEVTPEDAQRLRLAGEVGELSLALRSVEDKETIETVAITRQSDLSQMHLPASSDDGKSLIQDPDKPLRVIRGTAVEIQGDKEK